MASDIERIRGQVSLPDIASQFGCRLDKDGAEFVGCCPFHSEKTASFTIFTGKDRVERFHCFGCGEHGDVLDFVQQIKGVDIKEAIAILGGGQSGPNVTPRHIEARDVYADIEVISPAADQMITAGRKVTLYNPKRAGSDREWGSFTPSMVHAYRDESGALIGYVLRHDLPDGGKETPMVMRVRLPNGTECWSRYPFPKPRSLYGIEAIGENRQVIVVEGEKCRDALAAMLGRAVVSWAGGTQGVKHADWSPLAGRNIVIWPDADGPGMSTANEIAGIVQKLDATARIVDVMGAQA